MLRGLTAEQFLGWLAYAELEPFDEMRADYRAASIVQMIANMNRDPKKHPKPFLITEFVLKFGEAEEVKKPQQRWQDQKAIARMYAAMYDNP